MAKKLKYNRLTPDQNHMMVDFIKVCFPEKEDETFTSYNEIKFVAITLHRVFKKYFGYSLSIRNVLYAFEKNNYAVYMKKGEEIWVKAEKEADRKEKPNYDVDLYTDLGVDAMYLKINSKKMHNYIRAAYDLPETAKDKKIQFKDDVVKEIMDYKKNWDKSQEVIVP